MSTQKTVDKALPEVPSALGVAARPPASGCAVWAGDTRAPSQKGRSLVVCSVPTIFVPLFEPGPLAFTLHWGPLVLRAGTTVWSPRAGGGASNPGCWLSGGLCPLPASPWVCAQDHIRASGRLQDPSDSLNPASHPQSWGPGPGPVP